MLVVASDCALDYAEAITQSFLIDPDVGEVDEHTKAGGRTVYKGFHISGT